MKSIFRKIAFVLALVMVVGLLPVKTAAADVKDNKYARKKNATLYVGGEATRGDYESCWSVQTTGKKLKTDEKYTIDYVSSNPDVATVNKYGLVEAVSVGETTITVTFSKEGEENIVESFDVKVKKNAVNVALDKDSQAALEAGLTVGDEAITLAAVQTASDDKNDATDTVKFYCASKEDKEIIDLDAATGKLTAKKAGEAKVVVYTYQTEYDSVTKKYATVNTAKSGEYTVVVKEAGIVSAKQVNRNTVALTCGSETAAADIAANMANLTVTYKFAEKDFPEVVKEVKADKEVVNVVLYNDLVKDTIYTFKYGENMAEVTGADLTAVASIEVTTTTVVAGVSTPLTVKYYNANDVELPAENMTGVLNFAVSGTENEYFFDSYTNNIWFYEVGKYATVVATYIKGYNTDGTEDKITSRSVVVRSVDASVTNNQMDGWAVDDEGKASNTLTYSQDTQRLVVGENKVLYGKYTVTPAMGQPYAEYTQASLDSARAYQYSSTNDKVLIVGEDGHLYPASEGTATVIVRKGNATVGMCNFIVTGSRNLATFRASVNKNKLSIASSPEDSATITTIFTDQLGSENAAEYVSYSIQTVNTWPTNLTLNVGGNTFTGLNQTATISNTKVKELAVSATGTGTVSKGTVQLLIIATQGNRSIRSTVSFEVKTVSAPAARYDLELGNANIDTNLSTFASWEGIGKVQSAINLVGYDNDGFVVSREIMSAAITHGTDTYTYKVFRNGVDVTSAMAPSGTFNAVAVSGTAVSGGSITKQPTGVYQVMLYKGTAQAKLQSITVRDTDAVTLKVNDINGVGSDLANLQTKLTFYRDGKDITSNIISVSAVAPVAINGSANRYYVPEVAVTERISSGNETINGFTYTYYIKVGATFYQ